MKLITLKTTEFEPYVGIPISEYTQKSEKTDFEDAKKIFQEIGEKFNKKVTINSTEDFFPFDAELTISNKYFAVEIKRIKGDYTPALKVEKIYNILNFCEEKKPLVLFLKDENYFIFDLGKIDFKVSDLFLWNIGKNNYSNFEKEKKLALKFDIEKAAIKGTIPQYNKIFIPHAYD